MTKLSFNKFAKILESLKNKQIKDTAQTITAHFEHKKTHFNRSSQTRIKSLLLYQVMA